MIVDCSNSQLRQGSNYYKYKNNIKVVGMNVTVVYQALLSVYSLKKITTTSLII